MARIVLAFLIAIMVAGVAPVPMPAPGDSYGVETVAAKPQKDKKTKTPKAKVITRGGCKIKAKGKSWSLLRDCDLTGRITLPSKVEFNGRGFVIRVKALPNRNLPDAVLYSSGAKKTTIQNVSIVGIGLLGSCAAGDSITGISANARAVTIDRVRVEGLRVGGDCSYGIDARGTVPSSHLTLTNIAISGVGDEALDIRRFGSGTISGIDASVDSDLYPWAVILGGVSNLDISNMRVNATAGIGIRISTGINLTLTDINLDGDAGGDDGITVDYDSSNITIFSVRIDGYDLGINLFDTTDATVLRSTIFGATVPYASTGIAVGDNATGLIDDNSISSFYCGISLSDSNSGVVIGDGNGFSNNADDVCREP